MPSNLARVVCTLAIWGFLPLIFGVLHNDLESSHMVIVVALGMIAAAASTSAIWKQDGVAHDAAQAEKAKRERLSGAWIDSLSEADFDALRARLEERERMVPLESLLSEPPSRRAPRP